MKVSRFSDAQKAFILKQGADGVPVAYICRRAGIRQATYFKMRRHVTTGYARAEAVRSDALP